MNDERGLTAGETIQALIEGIQALKQLTEHAEDVQYGQATCRCLRAALQAINASDPKEYFVANACDVAKAAYKKVDLARDAAFAWDGTEF